MQTPTAPSPASALLPTTGTSLRIDFPHRQSAHCESGVSANLLKFHGMPVSEALIFGIGAGLFFSYVPFIKVLGAPMLSFRHLPGRIFKKATRRLNVQVFQKNFRSPARAMQALDHALQQGQPAGIQVGVFWLPFFPPALRFHFNAHNMVVYGKQNDTYLISDPVLDQPVECDAKDLQKARYAKGFLAPKGRLYYPTKVPQDLDLKAPILQGLRETCDNALKIPFPFFGIRGIRLLAKDLRRWPQKHGERTAKKYLTHLIRMQEEIGTGGAGFRFIFAAFLQEASQHLPDLAGPLQEASDAFTQTGDRWRELALIAARVCKGRFDGAQPYDDLASILLECAQREEDTLRTLQQLLRKT